MHWLPLVAMVIASALPFPHSPVTRIVAATTETGASRSDPPVSPPALYRSHGNFSQNAHHTNAASGKDATVGNHQTTQIPEQLKRTMLEELSTDKGTSQKIDQSKSDLFRDDLEGRSNVENTRTSNCDSYNDNVSVENAVLQDYKSDSTASRQGNIDFQDSTQKENSLFSLDSGIEGSDNRPLPLSVQEPRNGVSRAASQQVQRVLGAIVPREKPWVVTDTATGGRLNNNDEGSEGGLTRSVEIPGLEGMLGLGGTDAIQDVDELFLDAHPRVLFSPSASPPEHPPVLLMLESGALPEDGYGEGEREREDPLDADGHAEGHGEGAVDRSSSTSWATAHAHRRNKRSHLSEERRGERSVCESESVWVTDKTSAIDINRRVVTILPTIQTQRGPLKQYFYETRCRRAEQPRNTSMLPGARGSAGIAPPPGLGVAGAGCVGVDKKQWKSECKAKQSYVRALTKDGNNRTTWNWIRIDSSCVCVLMARVKREPLGKR